MTSFQTQPIYDRAKRVLVGGVNSPVRAFKSVGLDPLVIASGNGPSVVDANGKSYLDFVGAWGPLILGHRDEEVLAAIHNSLERGISYGFLSESEVELAELVTTLVPSMEKVRFVNSGTEATMSAIRLARGATGRSKIIKFNGCYHGHADSFLIKAGSGGLTFGTPDSAGVPQGVAGDTLVAEFNDLASVERLFAQNLAQIAACIVEPVPGNMGVVLPSDGFLQGLRNVCTKDGALLIFDEVMTGFRVHPQGAQALYGIEPDITCLGKIIGGGFPVGAYGASKDLMARIAPEGDVYQAGTMAGNPIAMAAGLASLKKLQRSEVQLRYRAINEHLLGGMRQSIRELGAEAKVQLNAVYGMFTTFFSTEPVTDLPSVMTSNRDIFRTFFVAMLERGVLLAPSAFEACFTNTALSDRDMEQYLSAYRASLAIALK